MKVEVIDRKDQAIDPLGGLQTKVADLVDYTNKITQKSDPMVHYGGNRFAHASTLVNMGFRIRNVETQMVLTASELFGG